MKQKKTETTPKVTRNGRPDFVTMEVDEAYTGTSWLGNPVKRAIVTCKQPFEGAAVITVTACNGLTSTCKVTFEGLPSEVQVSTQSPHLMDGDVYLINERGAIFDIALANTFTGPLTDSAHYENFDYIYYTIHGTVTDEEGNRSSYEAYLHRDGAVPEISFDRETRQLTISGVSMPGDIEQYELSEDCYIDICCYDYVSTLALHFKIRVECLPFEINLDQQEIIF